MITALNIEDRTRRGIGAALSLLRRNRIRAEHRYCDSAAIKLITYERRRGKVSWDSIDRFVKSERGRILCPEGVELPSERGYRRFECRELSRRLCCNAALYLLRESGRRHIRTALIDRTGELAGLCSELVGCTDSLRVVTDNPRFYLREADRLLEERGAAIRVGTLRDDLSDEELIVAPHGIDGGLNCSADAVVLSGEPPKNRLSAPVICNYYFDLPQKYLSLRPDWLDEMYFAEAMFTLAGARELGDSLFRRCSDGAILHTRLSLIQKLKAGVRNEG